MKLPKQQKENSAAPHRYAFTLIEVMIAIGVFCIGVFAVLELVASVLHGARIFNKPMVDAGVIASEIAQTNKLVEVRNMSGDLSDFLGKTYQGYTYTYDITEVQSNRLFELDVVLQGSGSGRPVLSKMAVLLYRPASPAGTLDGGMTGH
jgi:prepilin-type N-terminal cleavage/methylation domain-containing protein